MGNLKQEATDYVPPQKHSIDELPQVDLEAFEVLIGEGKDSKGKIFKYKYIIVDDEEYRVPNPVFEQIQSLLSVKPELRFVKVLKSGSGIATKYQTKALQ